jgi:23S rRNA pseudouridine1911/1915/1917 synthase
MNSNNSTREATPRLWEGIASPLKPMRADRYLAEVLKGMTRSQLKARGARLLCNDKEVKLSYRLKGGERLRLEWVEPPSEEIVPEPVPLNILYRDGEVFVFDKPQGLVTHPGAGNWCGTLANGVAWLEREAQLHSGEFAEVAPPPRAGIVHRLDKDTSGVIIVARSASAHEFLARQFRERLAKKEYYAIVVGSPPTPRGRIDTWLARSPRDRKKFAVSPSGRGKHALTLYRVCATWSFPVTAKGAGPRDSAAAARHSSTPHHRSQTYALLALYPKTGRTHQLRVHCAHMGCPILGDPIYGKKNPLFPEATLMLHARRLKICLPSCLEPSIFKASLPARFKEILAFLNAEGATRP